jgi:hypothetical protein
VLFLLELLVTFSIYFVRFHFHFLESKKYTLSHNIKLIDSSGDNDDSVEEDLFFLTGVFLSGLLLLLNLEPSFSIQLPPFQIVVKSFFEMVLSTASSLKFHNQYHLPCEVLIRSFQNISLSFGYHFHVSDDDNLVGTQLFSISLISKSYATPMMVCCTYLSELSHITAIFQIKPRHADDVHKKDIQIPPIVNNFTSLKTSLVPFAITSQISAVLIQCSLKYLILLASVVSERIAKLTHAVSLHIVSILVPASKLSISLSRVEL